MIYFCTILQASKYTKMKTYFFLKLHTTMSLESLISTYDYLTQIYNACQADFPTSVNLITISNWKYILSQAIKAYKEPEEFIKTRLSHILDYIYNHSYSSRTALKSTEFIQWLIEDIKHYFTNNLRINYTTGRYMYNSLVPITWKGLDRKQWDYYIIPELILPETKRVQFTIDQPPQLHPQPETPKNNTSTAYQQYIDSKSNAKTNKWVPSYQRKSQQKQQQPKSRTQRTTNDKMVALKAKYGGV